jgi:DNA polymerase sliding clamp subunit (PCNA homolog)
VPRKFLSYLSSHLGDEEIILSIGETHLTAKIEEDTIISRTISEVFPDYESVIPTDNNNTLIVDKKALLGAIKRVSIFSNKSTHQVAFNISKEQFFITTEDPESSSKAREEIIATYEGGDLIIGYNGEYLKDVINHISGNEVIIKLNTPISATLFTGHKNDENKIMLLMPVRINT